MTVGKPKKLVKLSKTAKLLFEITKIPRVLARRVGMFLGTDLPYLPGGLFVRYEDWSGWDHPTCRLVNVVRIIEGRGRIRWYKGRRFAVFEVVRVTPQTLTVRRIKTVDVFFKWAKSKDLETKEVEPNTELAGVFSYELNKPEVGLERLKIRRADADAMKEYKNVDMTQAQKFEYHNYQNYPRTTIIYVGFMHRVSKILHDVETETLEVKYFPNEWIP
jgi:hypothetical protein